MASASITTRKTNSGGRRYVVRFRRGGSFFPIEHGGSFLTLREARLRRDLIAGELAAGRDPGRSAAMTEKPNVADVRVRGRGVPEPRRHRRGNPQELPRPPGRLLPCSAGGIPRITCSDVQERSALQAT